MRTIKIYVVFVMVFLQFVAMPGVNAQTTGNCELFVLNPGQSANYNNVGNKIAYEITGEVYMNAIRLPREPGYSTLQPGSNAFTHTFVDTSSYRVCDLVSSTATTQPTATPEVPTNQCYLLSITTANATNGDTTSSRRLTLFPSPFPSQTAATASDNKVISAPVNWISRFNFTNWFFRVSSGNSAMALRVNGGFSFQGVHETTLSGDGRFRQLTYQMGASDFITISGPSSATSTQIEACPSNGGGVAPNATLQNGCYSGSSTRAAIISGSGPGTWVHSAVWPLNFNATNYSGTHWSNARIWTTTNLNGWRARALSGSYSVSGGQIVGTDIAVGSGWTTITSSETHYRLSNSDASFTFEICPPNQPTATNTATAANTPTSQNTATNTATATRTGTPTATNIPVLSRNCSRYDISTSSQSIVTRLDGIYNHFIYAENGFVRLENDSQSYVTTVSTNGVLWPFDAVNVYPVNTTDGTTTIYLVICAGGPPTTPSSIPATSTVENGECELGPVDGRDCEILEAEMTQISLLRTMVARTEVANVPTIIVNVPTVVVNVPTQDTGPERTQVAQLQTIIAAGSAEAGYRSTEIALLGTIAAGGSRPITGTAVATSTMFAGDYVATALATGPESVGYSGGGEGASYRHEESNTTFIATEVYSFGCPLRFWWPLGDEREIEICIDYTYLTTIYLGPDVPIRIDALFLGLFALTVIGFFIRR